MMSDYQLDFVKILVSEVSLTIESHKYVIDDPIFDKDFPWIKEKIKSGEIKIAVGNYDYYLVVVEYNYLSHLAYKKDTAILFPGDYILNRNGVLEVQIESKNRENVPLDSLRIIPLKMEDE